MYRKVKIFNGEELVFEGVLNEFLEINKDDKDFILSQIDFNNKISEFTEVSGCWKIVFEEDLI